MRSSVWIAAALALIASLVGCSADRYPMPAGPPRTAQLNPAKVAEPVTAVVLYITIRPGDRIELLGAEPIGVAEGASVRFFLSRPILQSDGSSLIGSELETLEGAELRAVSASPGPDNAVGIVGELTAHRPGRYELTSVRLRYRINGRAEQVGEGIDVVWTVCADDPKPTDCPELPESE